MSRTSRIAAVAIFLAGVAFGVLFCLANDDSLQLDLVFFRLPAAPLGVWVLGAFIVGGVLGLLASSLALWRMRLAAATSRRGAAGEAAAVGAVAKTHD